MIEFKSRGLAAVIGAVGLVCSSPALAAAIVHPADPATANAFDADPDRPKDADASMAILLTGGATSLTENPLAQTVPEPGTWSLLIFGFGLAGARLRDRRLVRAAQSLLSPTR